MNLVFLGLPGSGKGTQAVRLARRLSIPHLSTGDLLRAAVRDKTPRGRDAEKYMHAGELVPDSVIIELIGEKKASGELDRGFVMDGFPRTVPQAEALDALFSNGHGIDRAVLLEVDEDEIVRRLSNRLSCETCHVIYGQVTNPPKREGICDLCGGHLGQRQDDEPEVIKKRLSVYQQQSRPVEEHYRKRSLLVVVPAVGTPDEIFARVIAGLDTKVNA
ncbi:MAG: adenylate kinase [candidate division Zixibacteria bacterium]|nr:adenylate kinase [candidate division Zixibacteria bacterium]